MVILHLNTKPYCFRSSQPSLIRHGYVLTSPSAKKESSVDSEYLEFTKNIHLMGFL